MPQATAQARSRLDLVVFVPQGPDGRVKVSFCRPRYDDVWDLLIRGLRQRMSQYDLTDTRARQLLQREGWRVLRCRLSEEAAGEVHG